MTYSMDLRERVVAAVNHGAPIAVVARRFNVSRPTVRDWRDRAKRQALAPGTPGPKDPIKLTADDDQRMRDAIARRPGITLRELQAVVATPVAESTICRRLKRLGLTLKKSR